MRWPADDKRVCPGMERGGLIWIILAAAACAMLLLVRRQAEMEDANGRQRYGG
jgi:hypothetical protein